MRLRIYCLSLVSIFVCAHALSAQDLGLLPARVSRFWELRQQMNRLESQNFVDPNTRQTYLQGRASPILGFKIVGLEFTDGADRYEVIVKVRSVIPQIGEIDRTVRESWIWKDGNWFMQALTVQKLFEADDDRPAPAVTAPPKFLLTNAVIDLGRIVQGKRMEGAIPFQADRSEIRVIRPIQEIPGLAIGAPVWSGPSQGHLPYQWDTTLTSKDVNQTITLEATATSDIRVSADVQIRARIDGRVAFNQVPEVIDPTKAGQVELQIQNLSTETLNILSVVSQNRAYVVDEDVPESIAPGKSGRMVIRYRQQSDSVGASLNIVFSENMGLPPVVSIPLNTRIPEDRPAAFTREELEGIIKSTPRKP